MAVSAAGNAQVDRYVEELHIDHIPAEARHGKPWHQFAFWFGNNVNVFNIVVGAVVVSIGLTFWARRHWSARRAAPLSATKADDGYLAR
jgi:cytosine/uracil/thiamine/allantoin permease